MAAVSSVFAARAGRLCACTVVPVSRCEVGDCCQSCRSGWVQCGLDGSCAWMPDVWFVFAAKGCRWSRAASLGRRSVAWMAAAELLPDVRCGFAARSGGADLLPDVGCGFAARSAAAITDVAAMCATVNSLTLSLSLCVCVCVSHVEA
eukprot:scaffold90086_cov21-Tisochrysis_lutea.AAC.2